MAQKRRKKVWLTEKDVNLFRYLHQVKVATLDQINRDVYQYSVDISLYKRLANLQQVGYLKSSSCEELPKKKIVSLSETAFKKFLADGTEKSIELKSQVPAHDLTLVDIRNRLLSSPKVSRYYSENELKTWNMYWKSDEFSRFVEARCDAVICAAMSKGKVHYPVEYESTQKNADRIKQIIKRYYKNDDIPLILYVCSKQRIIDKFKAIEAEFVSNYPRYDGNKIFYISLAELLDNDCLKFTDLEGNTLQIGVYQNQYNDGIMAI